MRGRSAERRRVRVLKPNVYFTGGNRVFQNNAASPLNYTMVFQSN